MIRRLAYVSRPRPNFALTELPRIVSVSRVRNATAGITGVLLFTGLDFAQLIEGDPQAVRHLWQRIVADDRHRDPLALIDERSPERWFRDWRVGYPSDSAIVGQIAAWRERAGVWDDSVRAQLRRVLGSIDTL